MFKCESHKHAYQDSLTLFGWRVTVVISSDQLCMLTKGTRMQCIHMPCLFIFLAVTKCFKSISLSPDSLDELHVHAGIGLGACLARFAVDGLHVMSLGILRVYHVLIHGMQALSIHKKRDPSVIILRIRHVRELVNQRIQSFVKNPSGDVAESRFLC